MARVWDRAGVAALRGAAAGRKGFALRVAVTVALCAGAYHYSLATLFSGVRLQLPLAGLALVPAISLLLVAVSGLPGADEPDIHDRYLDYIVGIPLLLGALSIVTVLPLTFAAFFWFWRLDLVSLPLFVAGAVALCFGSRALWRLRFPIAFLALACPGPEVLLANGASRAVADASMAALDRVLALVPIAEPVAAGGSQLVVRHGADHLVLRVDPATTVIEGVFAFLLVGIPLIHLARGHAAVRLAWLGAGVAVTWGLGIAGLLGLLAAGRAWGEPAVGALSPRLGPFVLDAGVIVMIAALPLLRLRFDRLVGWWPLARSWASGRVPAVPRVGPALAVLLVAGVVAATANESLRQFQLVGRPMGQPALAQSAALSRPVSGWELQPAATPEWVPAAVGESATWQRYRYVPAGTEPDAGQPITLDLLTTSSAGALMDRGVEAVYPLHTYRLAKARQVELAGGVIGHGVVYRERAAGGAWMAVSWDWPVQARAGVAYERVVLNVSSRSDAELRVAPPPAGADRPGAGVRTALVDALTGTDRSATPAETRTLDYLAEFGRRVVLTSAGGAASRRPA